MAERCSRAPARRRVVRGLAPSACGPGPLAATPGLSPKNTRDGEQYRASNMSARTQAPKQTTCFIDDINKLA